jgi:hypothetical protein
VAGIGSWEFCDLRKIFTVFWKKILPSGDDFGNIVVEV